MDDYINRYIKRLNSKGSNLNDASINKSKRIHNEKFTTSPSYKSVLLNDTPIDAIVYDESNHNEKTILFRPDTKVNIGSVVKIDDKTYLLMSFFDRELDPKGELVLCNNSLTIQGEPTETQVGTNPYTGEPVYEYQDGVPTTYPCIVTMQLENEDLENQPIRINNDVAQVTLPYFDFKETQIELYGDTYQVKTIDKTKVIDGVGLLTVLGEKV